MKELPKEKFLLFVSFALAFVITILVVTYLWTSAVQEKGVRHQGANLESEVDENLVIEPSASLEPAVETTVEGQEGTARFSSDTPGAASQPTDTSASAEADEAGTVKPVPDKPEPVSLPPTGAVTAADRATFLQGHNSERSSLGLPSLTWSTSLALSAQQWANTLQKSDCSLRHSSSPNGENLYVGWTKTPPTTSSAPKAVAGWLAEEVDYTYADNSCAPGKVCSHYTQMVWADTTAVGCGMASCNAAGVYKDLWVCQYAPAGNVAGQRPY